MPIVAGLALLGAVAAVVIAVSSAGTRAEDVAGRVTPEVTSRVIADSRAKRADDARRLLAEENSRLSSRGLPIVADPGRDASADEVVGAWVTARVLGALPPSVTDELAAQVADGRQPRVLPSVASPGSFDAGDLTVTVVPEDDPPVRTATPLRPRGGSGGSPPAATRPTTRAPSPAPAPAPAAPPRGGGGGLLRPCLLGAVLC